MERPILLGSSYRCDGRGCIGVYCRIPLAFCSHAWWHRSGSARYQRLRPGPASAARRGMRWKDYAGLAAQEPEERRYRYRPPAAQLSLRNYRDLQWQQRANRDPSRLCGTRRLPPMRPSSCLLMTPEPTLRLQRNDDLITRPDADQSSAQSRLIIDMLLIAAMSP
jgi:hypothetical protein